MLTSVFFTFIIPQIKRKDLDVNKCFVDIIIPQIKRKDLDVNKCFVDIYHTTDKEKGLRCVLLTFIIPQIFIHYSLS